MCLSARPTKQDHPIPSGLLPLTGNGFLKKIAEEATAGLSSPEEKIAALFSYVKQNIVWDGSPRMYPSSPLRKVLDDKKGSSAEINFLLASMLEKIDIEVLPVVLSTRSNGFVQEASPVSSQFNYMICLAKVNDKSILLDATERPNPFGYQGRFTGDYFYRSMTKADNTKMVFMSKT